MGGKHVLGHQKYFRVHDLVIILVEEVDGPYHVGSNPASSGKGAPRRAVSNHKDRVPCKPGLRNGYVRSMLWVGDDKIDRWINVMGTSGFMVWTVESKFLVCEEDAEYLGGGG